MADEGSSSRPLQILSIIRNAGIMRKVLILNNLSSVHWGPNRSWIGNFDVSATIPHDIFQGHDRHINLQEHHNPGHDPDHNHLI